MAIRKSHVAAGTIASILGLAMSGCATDTAAGGGAAEFGGLSCPAEAAETISGDSIKLGISSPQSGPYAASGVGTAQMQAYFDRLNEDGGIETADGTKKIELVSLDDQYDPARSFANIRELVEKHEVDAIVAHFGSSASAASAPYLNKKCVPHLFINAGSETVLSEELPFSTQAITYVEAGQAVGRAIAENHPGATVATIGQNDDIGNGIVKGVKLGLEGTDVKVVAEETYEPTAPTISNQMRTLAASGADVLLDASLGVKCTQALNDVAKSSWEPVIFTTLNCTSKDFQNADAGALVGGAYQLGFLMPPLGDEWPEQAEFRDLLTEAGLELNPAGVTTYQAAYLAIQAIENAEELTRIGIAKSATELPASMPDTEPPSMFLPGIETRQGIGVPTLGTYAIQEWDEASGSFVATESTVGLD